jgi:hypothetical protein
MMEASVGISAATLKVLTAEAVRHTTTSARWVACLPDLLRQDCVDWEPPSPPGKASTRIEELADEIDEIG